MTIGTTAPIESSSTTLANNEGVNIGVKAEESQQESKEIVLGTDKSDTSSRTSESPPTLAKEVELPSAQNDTPDAVMEGTSTTATMPDRPAISKAREIRLEQNRKAARESRRRKKMMIEELQRSVIFFSRANGTLKQQNDELTRLLIQAQTQVAAMGSGQCAPRDKQGMAVATPVTTATTTTPTYGNVAQQAQAQAVATQAMYESQGFPPAAARAAAQTMNAGVVVNVAPSPAPNAAAPNAPGPIGAPTGAPNSTLPPMQTGATMQAMASFQQAAAVAMQAAMGMNPATTPTATQATAAPGSYADTINAIAMQQAAGAQFAVMQMQQQPTTYMPSWQHQTAGAPIVAEPQPAQMV